MDGKAQRTTFAMSLRDNRCPHDPEISESRERYGYNPLGRGQA
jgi:hypothetical protein